jgi:hypothetical protein
MSTDKITDPELIATRTALTRGVIDHALTEFAKLVAEAFERSAPPFRFGVPGFDENRYGSWVAHETDSASIVVPGVYDPHDMNPVTLRLTVEIER